MRLIVALFLIFAVLIDFSISCQAEGLVLYETELSKLNTDINDQVTESCPLHTHSSTSTDSHHCHTGHVHAVVDFHSAAIVVPTPESLLLLFFDMSSTLSSSFLSEITRPPIAV